jgi:hypothetical protein
MASSITQETLAWPFQDTEWKNKFLIGSFLAFSTFIPLVGLLAYLPIYGYALVVMRDIIQGKERTLPKWDAWSDFFLDGLKAGLATIGYLLPSFLVMFIGYIALFVSPLISMLPAFMQGKPIPEPDLATMVIGYLVFFVCLILGMALSLVGLVFMPIALGQYVRTGQISSGYNMSEIWAILRANAAGFVVALVFYFGIAMALSTAVTMLMYTVILCCLIPILMGPVTIYLVIMYATFFGTAYRDGWNKINSSLPTKTS